VRTENTGCALYIRCALSTGKYGRIPKRVLRIKVEATRPRGRPRNRWQDEVSKDGRIVGGEEWQGKVYDREEWTKVLRTARNHRILHMPNE
jgi:hypothetical protein